MGLQAVGGSAETTDDDLGEPEGSDFGLKFVLCVILAAFVWQFVRSALPLMFSGGLFTPLVGFVLLLIPALVLTVAFTNLWKSRSEAPEQVAAPEGMLSAVPDEPLEHVDPPETFKRAA